VVGGECWRFDTVWGFFDSDAAIMSETELDDWKPRSECG
jgi:hypothetical protein